jgi:hypothetical protein
MNRPVGGKGADRMNTLPEAFVFVGPIVSFSQSKGDSS